MITGIVLIAAGIIVGVLAGYTLHEGRDSRTHQALKRLADGLRLARGERRLIIRVAHATRTSSPATLLVSQGCFDRAASQYQSRHGRRRQLATLRRKIFGPRR